MFSKIFLRKRKKGKEKEDMTSFSYVEKHRKEQEINSLLATASSYMNKKQLKQLRQRLESSTAL